VKLADRLHNLETLHALAKARQKRNAIETLEVYSPLAERLGMGEIKGKLDDLCFPYVYPEEYKRLKKESKTYYEKVSYNLKNIKSNLEKKLKDEGVMSEIKGRRKHLYSLWKKLERENINWDFEKVNDIVAFRIIVETIKDCYIALGMVHKYYKPVPKISVSDFIAQPKPNGYRSIHTKVFSPKGQIIEIQIRTKEMHEEAEFGAAAHLAYASAKESGAKDRLLESGAVNAGGKFNWVKQLVQWQKEITDSEEFLESVKLDAFHTRIMVFSPKGDVYDLPEGATCIDFAYAVHTGIGKYISGSKVNQKMVPLSKTLENGDIVEIIKLKTPRKPKRDWLEFVVTTDAKQGIRKELRKND